MSSRKRKSQPVQATAGERCAKCGYTRLVETMTQHVAPLYGESTPTLHDFVPEEYPQPPTHRYVNRVDPQTGHHYVASVKVRRRRRQQDDPPAQPSTIPATWLACEETATRLRDMIGEMARTRGEDPDQLPRYYVYRRQLQTMLDDFARWREVEGRV